MTDRTTFRDLAAPAAARAAIDDFDGPDRQATVPLTEARGRVLAASIDAGIDVPGFDRAAMDGVAVRASDVRGATEVDPVEVPVAASVGAGERPPALEAGTAIGVDTGAVLPEGADAVVKIEDCVETTTGVAVRRAVPPGANVTPAGADVAAGDRALTAGVRLEPRRIGLLAAVGRETVPVRAAPQVAVVPTGGELAGVGDTLDHAAGEVHDVNGPTIAAAVAALGADPVRFDPVPDDAETMRATLERAADAADLVLTAGSTSAGERDLVPQVVADLGTVAIHGVAIKPGKPTLVGRIADTPAVGLPGYPVSALSIFRLFVAPTIADWTGTDGSWAARTRSARLLVGERFDAGRHRALPVGLVASGAGELLAYPVDRGSGATTSLAHADGVVEMAAETRRLAADATVEVAAFDDGPLPDPLVAGEADPAVATALDRIDAPGRYRTIGDGPGRRWLADGVPDLAVVTGDPPADAVATRQREWGLIVAPEAGVASLEDCPGRTIATHHRDVGLREAFERALDDRGIDRAAIEEFGGTRGLESPARRVASGAADAAPGLPETAEALGLEYVPVSHQRVAVVAGDGRTDKAGVGAAIDAIEAEFGGE